jgi:taurine dioxygenase
MLELHPITATIGAEILGVDLTSQTSLIDDALFEALHAALVEHQVLVFRDQQIGPAQHLALALRFGTPVAHPAYPSVPGYPVVNILENNRENPPKIDTWHTDMTFMERPPLGSILRAVTIPPAGGDTLFASLSAAYQRLSDRMQRYLEGLEAYHSFAHGFRQSLAEPGGLERLGDAVRDNPPRRHPVIRTHPISGAKLLFVNRLFTTHLIGVGERESAAVLGFLYDHLETPEHTCRLRWRPGTIAFWDNRSTMHRPVNDFWPAVRVMQRITIAGDRPT